MSSTPEERKKELAKQLSEWKANYKKEHERNPTQADIDADETVSGWFKEYTKLKQELANPSSTGAAANNEQQEQQPATTTNNNEATSAAAEQPPQVDLEARKKELAKMLNDWKTNFKAEKGHGPKQEDIDADPVIKATFEEFTCIKKGIPYVPSASSTAAAAESNPPTTQEQEPPKPDNEETSNQKEQEKEPESSAAAAATSSEQPQEQQPQQENGSNIDVEARKKELAKILNDWKTNFKAEKGHGPKQEDIDTDPVIKATFEEFTCIKKGIPYVPSSAVAPAPAPAAAEDQQQETKPAEEQKQPEQQQQEQQEQAAPAQATSSSAPEDNTNKPSDEPASSPSASKSADDLETRKKELAKILNDWKINFKAEKGHGPKQDDIDADPVIKATFEEFTCIKKGIPYVPSSASPPVAAAAAEDQQKEDESKSAAAATSAPPPAEQATTETENKPEEETAPPSASAPTQEQQQQPETQQQPEEQQPPTAEQAPEQEKEKEQAPDPDTKKKELALLLSDWKTDFKKNHPEGKGPRQADIDADDRISDIFVQYTSLKGGASVAESEEVVEKHRREREDAKKKKQEEEEQQAKEAAAASLAKKQEEQQQDENKQEQQQQQQQQQQENEQEVTADEMKKTLAKQLSEWKSDFKSQHDRNPKQADIENDFEINIIFQQYNLLKKGGSVAEANALRATTMASMISVSQPEDDHDDDAENKKQGGEENNQDNNNNNIVDENKMAMASATAATASENNSAYLNDGKTADDYYSPTSLEEIQARDERKRHLAKILAEWKSNFRSIHNKNPGQNDVLGDPEIREVYEEYSCLKSGKTYVPKNSNNNNNEYGSEEGGGSNQTSNYASLGGTLSDALQGAQQGIYGDEDDDDANNNNNNQQYDPNYMDGAAGGGEFTYTGQINMDNLNQPTDPNFINTTGDGANEEDNMLSATATNKDNLDRTSAGGFLRWLGDDEGGASGNSDVDPVTHEHNIKLWENATARARIFTIVEPSSSLVQPYTGYKQFTAVYQLVYFVLLLIYIACALAETVIHAEVNNLIRMICLGIPNMYFTFDFILRAGTVNDWKYVPMILVDLASLITCWIHLSERRVFDNDGDILRMIPQLRMFRLVLFFRLFSKKEFFRDIEIALLTVESSVKPLLLFAVLFCVFLLLFSTFIFLTERGDWNEFTGVWERPCREFVSTCTGVERSPFQSIPDGLWLTVQVMTTVGFGDTVPTSFWGRVVAGFAEVVGVFVIAFPTMLFIGNLEQVRKDYYAQLERERVERSYRLDMIKILQDQQAAAERAANARDMEMTMDLGATMNSMMNATMNATMNFASLGVKVSRDSNMVLFDEAGTNNDEIPADPLKGDPVATFSFMGHHARQIKKTRRGEFVYEPIMEFLCDPEDGAPVLSSVVEIDFNTYMAQLTLIVDDLVAQELATEAIFEKLGDDAPENGVAPRAAGVYGLEVAFAKGIPGLTVARRIDSSKINVNAVPITIEIAPGPTEPDVYDAQSARDWTRGLLARKNATFKISYSRAPVSTAFWQKSIPITSIMLSTTPFIHDLLEICTYSSVADMIETYEKRKHANTTARRRRNIAFVHRHDIPELVYPIFRKVIGKSKYVIRNASHFVESLTEMVVLHCRRVRHHEIPESLRSAIFRVENVSLSDELLEVDLDYFRSVDWPLGTVVVEFAEQRKRVSAIVPIMNGAELEQPIIADNSAFERAGIFQKDALCRLSTATNVDPNSMNDDGGGFSAFGNGNDDDDDEPRLRNQHHHGSMVARSNLFNQGISNEKRLASLLAPTEVSSFQ